LLFFFFKQKTAYEIRLSLVGSEMCIRDSYRGERIMHPDYGFGLLEQVFDPVDETALGDFRSQIEDAILRFEPRIKVEEIRIETGQIIDGYLEIHLSYWIPEINSRSNMVYPYYIEEGTNIRAP